MSYDRYESQRRRTTYGSSSRRTTLGYWVPLAVTVTVATIGLAAWVWKERSDNDDEDDQKNDGRPPPGHSAAGPGGPPYSRPGEPPYSGPGGVPYPGPGELPYSGTGGIPYAPGTQPSQVEDSGFVARMQGALRRTPSPQQIFDEAGRRVVAGVTAAGAVVGGALTSIREEDKGDYEDHSRWSEEATARASGSAPLPSPQVHKSTQKGKKIVAIVVSADTGYQGVNAEEVSYLQEHASILSHLPEHINDDCRVFVMIYAPDLQEHPQSSTTNSRPAASLTSSYSNIEHEDFQTPGEEGDESVPLLPQTISNSGSPMFNALYSQAQTLVDKGTMIMPFTTPAGYVSLLRHIAPEVVYVQGSLSGANGEAVKHISGWVGQVVLVVGDDTGHGGLVDSEDDQGTGDEVGRNWWKDDAKIGLGKGIEVVEGLRVGEDFKRRVRGHD